MMKLKPLFSFMNKDTLLLRQVHPSFVQGDSISSQVFTTQVFKPTAKDDNKLSVYNGNIFNAENSHSHYLEKGNISCGVVAVTKNECDSNELPVLKDDIPFKGHCSIDYNGLSNKQKNKKSKKLKSLALHRGWLFRHN